jgi:hypothetical protein
MLKLDAAFREQLLNSPESGMGYQVVVTLSKSYNISRGLAKAAREINVRRGIVYNAELLLFEDEPRVTFTSEAFTRLLSEAKAASEEIISLQVIPRAFSISPAVALQEASASYGKKSTTAKDAPIEKIREMEIFKRFTAYPNDRRVWPDGSLLPNTYTTTEEDARNVRTGRDAVARYALPNPQPASNVFTIRPHADTFIRRGIVEPAYNQPGEAWR